MPETTLLKQIRALVVTMAYLSVMMPSPITYLTWWKDKPENRKYYVIWAVFVIISALVLYHFILNLNNVKAKKELAGV